MCAPCTQHLRRSFCTGPCIASACDKPLEHRFQAGGQVRLIVTVNFMVALVQAGRSANRAPSRAPAPPSA